MTTMPRAAAAGGSDCALPPHCERRGCRWDRLTSPAVCHVAPARRPSLPESILQQQSQLRVLPTALRTPPVSRLIKTPKPREQRKAAHPSGLVASSGAKTSAVDICEQTRTSVRTASSSRSLPRTGHSAGPRRLFCCRSQAATLRIQITFASR